MSDEKKQKLAKMKAESLLGGSQDRIDTQHNRGKLTARERIEILLDAGTFVESGAYVTHHAHGFGIEDHHPLGDGVVTGWGKIDDRQVYLYAQDFTVNGGSVGKAHADKISRIIELATQNGAPLIALNDSGGARIQEGVNALAGYGDIFYRNVFASGLIPQLSVILGPCAGGAVYSPAVTDFIFMVEGTANMFITGPDVVRAVTHEEVDSQSLGGSMVHSSLSGVAHFTAGDEKTLLENVRSLLAFLPSNNLEPPPWKETGDDALRPSMELEDIIPQDSNLSYDVRQIIETLVDAAEFMEVQTAYAPNLITGFSRFNGHTTGIVANQPDFLAGVLDINASDKGARFIRFCDAFHIPLLTLIDTPGFLPGLDQEHNGIIRHGAKMLFAYAEATVPKVSLILRKAYGGAYIVMSSRHLKGDINLALPGAEIAVMGPEGAVNIIHRKKLAVADDSKALRIELARQYQNELANPFVAASYGYLDDVIAPTDARRRIIDSFETLRGKRQTVSPRKHGNIPL